MASSEPALRTWSFWPEEDLHEFVWLRRKKVAEVVADDGRRWTVGVTNAAYGNFPNEKPSADARIKTTKSAKL